MLGAGAMGYDQVQAILAVRNIQRILVWSRTREHAEALAASVGGEVMADPDDAVRQADVVSCATPATQPLFATASVKPGTHFNAVGAYRPDMVELPAGLMEKAFVVVDDVDAAAVEAGDLIQAGRDPDATLRELLAGADTPVRSDVSVFKSVGIATQDVAAGYRALQNAAASGVGTRL
jgi:ornithine cyclodeaminase